MDEPEITTSRLRLGALRPEDAAALFAYRKDPTVRRFQGFAPETLEDAERFIGKALGTRFAEPGAWSQLAIRLRPSDELVGDLGVHLRADPRQGSIGFTLAPAHQGRGLATEAVAAMLDHLFTRLGVHRMTASIDPRNEPSIRLVRRLGMRQEAHHRMSYWSDGEWVDDLVFAVLASEWRERSEARHAAHRPDP